MQEPLPDGVAKGQMIAKDKLDEMLNEYYALRGWDKNGIPTQEKLKELDLAA
jgi:aldehyde:ferredoxin oxidoreductase